MTPANSNESEEVQSTEQANREVDNSEQHPENSDLEQIQHEISKLGVQHLYDCFNSDDWEGQCQGSQDGFEEAIREADKGCQIPESPNLSQMLQELGNFEAEDLADPDHWVYDVDWAELERARQRG
jgi:hypothetical protein